MVEAGRVIAGSARGIRLTAPGEGTRPLADRVKESLFGALEAEGVVGRDTAFLDLFAGSGAAGIEALSRRSARAVFVEEDGAACRVIEDNLRRAHLEEGKVIRCDVATFLGRDAVRNGAPFDCCLLDPPYAGDLLVPTLELLADPARGWLAPASVVIAKHFWRDAPAPQIGTLERYRERRFGETMLSFYRDAARGREE
ncbi:MAG: 16S rRNA (guanine(966)-N(2))-methyltransferase RsmD [Chloroflexota bacterium]|nr:16S rRNA (guanine(966)-N(2))-methyltransferase RsmD [Chloroflexota bacterium]